MQSFTIVGGAHMRRSSRRHSRKNIPTGLTIEVCEPRKLLSATSSGLMNLNEFPPVTLTRPVTLLGAYVGLYYDQDGFLAGNRIPTGLTIGVSHPQRGGISSSDRFPFSGDDGIEVRIDDVTSGVNNVVRTGLHAGASDRSWLVESHEYRIYGRYNSISPWTSAQTFVFDSTAQSRLSVRDAASFRDAGFKVTVPMGAYTYVASFGLDVASIPLLAVQRYTVQITNRDTGQIIHTITHSANSSLQLSQLLPDTPTPPGRYSARIRSSVFTAVRKVTSIYDVDYGVVTETAWSAPVNFNIYVAPVQVTGGTGATVDATPTIRWSPVSNAQSYEVWIGPPGSNQPTYRGSGFRGRSHEVATALPNGDYNFWVRAHLVGGGFSAWGTASNLTIGPPLTLQQTAARTLSWNAATGANRYEIWIDYLGGASQAGAQIVHETALTRTSYSLPARLPAGGYRVWVRAIRFEGRDVYRATWSRSLTIEVVDAADDQTEALTLLATNINQPDLTSIAVAESQHPDTAFNPDAVDQNSVGPNQSRDDVYGPITPLHSVPPEHVHDASLIDQLAAGDLFWLSGDQDGGGTV